MKTNYFIIGILSLTIISCQKEPMEVISENKSISEVSETTEGTTNGTKGFHAELLDSEYGPVTCDLENEDGSVDCGSQCANGAGCWTTTDCAANPTAFNDLLNQLFSPQEIIDMAINNEPITHPDLLQILRDESDLPLNAPSPTVNP